MAGVYRSSPNSSSGGRYHKVITLLVYGRLEKKTNLNFLQKSVITVQFHNIAKTNKAADPSKKKKDRRSKRAKNVVSVTKIT